MVQINRKFVQWLKHMTVVISQNTAAQAVQQMVEMLFMSYEYIQFDRPTLLFINFFNVIVVFV